MLSNLTNPNLSFYRSLALVTLALRLETTLLFSFKKKSIAARTFFPLALAFTDVTDQVSFNNVKTWITEIERYASNSVKKLLVGNKADLTSRRTVDKTSAEGFAKILEMPYIETSAKMSENVESAFVAMAREIKKQFADYPEEVTARDTDGSIFIQGTPVTATRGTTTSSSSSCCGASSSS